MGRLTDEVLENVIGWYEAMEQIKGDNVDTLQQATLRLLKELDEYRKIGQTPEQLLEVDRLYTEKCREVAELRKQQPTAYDVDKVIEKLESKARGEWGYPSVMEFEDVVNIVKAGGVDE